MKADQNFSELIIEQCDLLASRVLKYPCLFIPLMR